MEDRSLDEFLDAGSDDDPDSDQPDESAADSEADPSSDTDSSSDPDSSADPDRSSNAESSPTTDSPADPDTPDDTDTSSPPVPTEEVEPATSTFVRSPDGDTCEACGERVERRWRSDDGLVCAECKEW